MENCARGGGGVNEAAASGGGAGNGSVVAVGSYGLHNKNIMMGRHIHHYDDNGFDGGEGGSGGDAGPTIPLFTVGGGGGAVAVRLSQPFNTSPLSFKSPGVASALGFPFTCAQWKELERQAMVYKYMMASVPVPPDLLLPISTNTYTASPLLTFHTQSYSGKNRDLEPGRCKRTDGKKWRCSKEVAPNQKYCDRHLHRGRPRSRKPVEDHTLPANTTNNNTKKTRLQQPSPLESPSLVISQPAITSDKHNEVPQSVDARMDHTFSISPFSEQHRSLDWEFVAMGGSEEQWQQLMAYESSVYNNRDNNGQIFQPMNLFPCKDYYGYLNPDLGSLDKEFVNAWANGNISNNSNILESEMGILESHEHNVCTSNNLTYRSPVSWVPFGSGGPLAEVLKPSHPSSSSYISNGGDSISPAGTTVSSPSGVLQKTGLFSQSDGSVCNSPTLAAAEMAPPFQWLS